MSINDEIISVNKKIRSVQGSKALSPDSKSIVLESLKTSKAAWRKLLLYEKNQL
jgi:hypothetical protein